jgi:hypothetical protein
VRRGVARCVTAKEHQEKQYEERHIESPPFLVDVSPQLAESDSEHIGDHHYHDEGG